MISTASLHWEFNYYPFSNTSPVSFTQDLPPEQNADILLLGCGDARKVLFTCFADTSRKIDVTCCDIEPLIHARNVLLYSLLIEDTENLNIEHIWNIYHHWKLDKESVELLETQIQKLLQVSETADQWHTSAYGSSIRFCDARSLFCVRSYWTGFQLRNLPPSERNRRLNQLQVAIYRAKAFREKHFGKAEMPSSAGVRALSPIGFEALKDFAKVTKQWWDHGTMPSTRASTLEPTYLNPALLYSPFWTQTMGFCLEPLLGIPVSTAYTPVTKGSAFHLGRKNASPTQNLVDSAKSHFRQWASAFRKAMANKSVIRIFSGDALAFCFTLRNCQLTHRRSMNLPCDNWTTSLLELHHGDYGHNENAAPLSFDVVDTSNLVDHLGPINVIPIASALLKYHASSSLYTETLSQYDLSLIDRLNNFFGVDVRSMSLLLGLVAPDLFTNATNSFEEDPMISGVTQITEGRQAPNFQCSRLRWKRLQNHQESCNRPYIHMEANALAKFLVLVYNAMFKYEDRASIFHMHFDLSITDDDIMKTSKTEYNRASFASLLSFLKTTVASDWDRCVEDIYNSIFSARSSIFNTLNYTEDLLLNMHLYGVDNGRFKKPTTVDMNNAVLASILPSSKDVPDQLCVSVRVSRAQLRVFTRKESDEMGIPAFACTFEGGDPGDMSWKNTFTTVRIMFGTWHKQTEESNSYPYIDEDKSQLAGTSDMFVSAMVPTKMLLQAKRSVPWVKCELISTLANYTIFNAELGNDLCFARNKMTSKNVFITRYMPGMSALPALTLANTHQDKQTSTSTTIRFTDNGSKINKLIQHVTLDTQTAKTKLAIPSSTVEIKFKTPLTAIITIAECEKLEVKFPVPVSPSKYKVRIARKSLYIEIETSLFDPLTEDTALFLFPTFITEAPGATVPIPWTSTHVDLDAMPQIDLEDKHTISWLIIGHAFLMFSNRERHIRELKMAKSLLLRAQVDIPTDLKDGLFSIFMHYAGLKCQQADFFGLSKMHGKVQTFIFPSCLRLDLVNHTIVLDTAIIPLTNIICSDPRAAKFIQELTNHGLCQVKVSEAENRAWKAMMPALVERCRTAATWKHASDCEYLQAGEVPLPRGLSEDNVAPICSCGVGKFPPRDYLKRQMKRLPDLSYMVDRYATRAAISPIFAVPYVDDCTINGLSHKLKIKNLYDFEEFSAELKRYSMSQGVYNIEKCVITCESSKKERALRQASSDCCIVHDESQSHTAQQSAKRQIGRNTNRSALL